MSKTINISENHLKDESSIIENINLKNIPDNMEIDISKNKLQDKSAIIKNTDAINEDEEKYKLYEDINEKIEQFVEWSDEYQKLQQMKREISRKNSKLKEIIKKFSIDLTQGCLVNVLSESVMQLLVKYL
ncbi:MAG: hypothetical protein Q4D45_00635 [Lachnospiraceae bacterium]|nr:hypothetical protein [Lachnospiraceae bacterium]